MPPAYLQARNPNVPRPDYADGCTGKVRFDSPALAASVAKERKGFGPATKGDRRTRDVYRCQHCNGWHLGTSAGMQSRTTHTR
jgi:hypothetical protein